MKRDPHNKSNFTAAVGEDILSWDLRKPQKPSYEIKKAHETNCQVLDIDYNPNKPYTSVSGGEDNALRFWDLRKSDKCLLKFQEDSHWVQKVKYNRFHDQLVLSGSSSTFVDLWRAVSVSSIPLNNTFANLQTSYV
jgi:WD40 repeat protein